MKKQFFKFLKQPPLILSFFMLIGMQNAIAQQTITGTVADETNDPIPGANIVIKGTTNGTQTDFDGNFSIEAIASDVLVISYLGYATQEISVGNQTTINVKLVEDASKLEEVVVIGYGTAKKSDLTGAVAQVSAKSFENQPLTRVEDALQGRTAGVSVSGSGQPGAGIKVRVRGVNSITGNNNPLVVVDGVFGGDLRTINPNNIKSIEVLKDASALAIYGSRGSNGVILVTTKRGSGKSKISVDQFVSFSTVQRRIETTNSAQFARFVNEQSIAAGNDALYTNSEIAGFEANPIEYQDLIFQTGVTQNTQISASGATDDNLRYFLSGNYVDQEGTQITTGYERYSFRSNVNKEFNDKFSLAANVTASREITTNNPDAFGRADGSSLLRAITWDPTAPVRDDDGNYILRSPFELANNSFNPIRRLELSDHEVTGDRLNFTLNGKYNLTKNFSYSLVSAVSTLNQNTQAFNIEGDPNVTGFNFINFGNFKLTTHQVSNIFNWNNKFGKSNFDVTGVYEFQGGRQLFNGYNTTDQNVGGFYLADNGSNEFFTNDGNQSAIQSYLGRLSYNYDNFLLLTGSMRVDESSRFTKENRTGYFPSAALALNFSNFNFISNNETLSSLKFRVGWGEVGNQDINSSARFSLNNNGGVFSYDGENPVTGSVQVQEGNPNLTWETTVQTNVGLDFGLFNGRLSGSIDYFNKDTKDLLLQTIIPGTSIRTFINAGEVNNKGIDLSLSGNIIQSDNFRWESSVNLSQIDNKVTSLNGDVEEIVGNVRNIGGTGDRLDLIKVGEPLGTFYGFTFLGTWKSTDNIPLTDPTQPASDTNPPIAQPGDARFLRDENGERVLGPIGSGLPDITWGFNNTLTYKNWDLNIFINGASGFDVYNLVEGTLHTGGGNRTIRSLDVFNAWTPENETDIPRVGSPNLLNSSRWVEKGDFIRLSNLKLGHTFDSGFIKGITSLQLYASGQNLFLITDYKGYDPEVSSAPLTFGETATVDSAAGIDTGAYPNPTTGILGVKITF